LPFHSKSWDTVMFCDVLHHADDAIGMLREAARVARHSVIIKDHLAEGVLARPVLRLMDFVGNAPHGVTLPYNYFERAQWASAYRLGWYRLLRARGSGCTRRGRIRCLGGRCTSCRGVRLFPARRGETHDVMRDRLVPQSTSPSTSNR
jgi:hypothetical protein